MQRLVTAALLTTLLAACAAPEPEPGHRPAGASSSGPAAPPRPRLFISPAGEPFRLAADGPEPMRAWFDRADANHDGTLTLAEFSADHLRFFRSLDVNGDGFIDSPEVSRYENQIAPEILSAIDRGDTRRPEPRRGFRTDGSGNVGAAADDPDYEGPSYSKPRAEGRTGAAAFSLLDEPEPIRTADRNIDFRVSTQEWAAAAERRFNLLDANHDGRLEFAELHLLQPTGVGPAREPQRSRSRRR